MPPYLHDLESHNRTLGQVGINPLESLIAEALLKVCQLVKSAANRSKHGVEVEWHMRPAVSSRMNIDWTNTGRWRNKSDSMSVRGAAAEI